MKPGNISITSSIAQDLQKEYEAYTNSNSLNRAKTQDLAEKTAELVVKNPEIAENFSDFTASLSNLASPGAGIKNAEFMRFLSFFSDKVAKLLDDSKQESPVSKLEEKMESALIGRQPILLECLRGMSPPAGVSREEQYNTFALAIGEEPEPINFEVVFHKDQNEKIALEKIDGITRKSLTFDLQSKYVVQFALMIEKAANDASSIRDWFGIS